MFVDVIPLLDAPLDRALEPQRRHHTETPHGSKPREQRRVMSTKREAPPIPNAHTLTLAATLIALMGFDALEAEVIHESRHITIGLVDDRSAGLDRRSAHIEDRQPSAQLCVTFIDGERGPLPERLPQEPGRRAPGDAASDDCDIR